MNTTETSRFFLLKQRVAFGAIDIGRQLAQSMSDVYLSAFLLTVAKLPAGAVGFMFLLCKFIDAATDVIIGILVDKTNTRLGRSRPWLFAGGVVFAVGLFMMFQTPDFSVNGKVAYIWVAYIVFTLGLTMVNIPEGSLMALMTDDAHERTILGSIRGVTGTVGQSVLSMTVIDLVAIFSKGNEAIGYSRTALFYAGVMLLLVYFGALTIRELQVPEAPKKERQRSRNLILDLRDFFTTKNFVMELLLCFGNLFFMVATMSTMMYYCKFIVQNLDLVGTGLTALSVASLFPAFIVPTLNRKLTKRNIILIGAVVAAVGIVSRLLAPSMILVGMAVIGFGSGLIGTMLQATQPDIVDEITVKTGNVNAGLIMSLFSLGCQVGVGVVNSLVAFSLGAGGFDADAAVQSASSISSIYFVFTGLPLIGCAVIFLGMFFYDLDKKYPEIHAKLVQMRGTQNTEA